MKNSIAKALRVASRQTHKNPSDAQKESGNYAKGKLRWYGETIAIENPKGSKRSGVDANGKRWECTLPSAYGYFLGTEGKDGDHVDCYIGDDHDSKKVFVIDQIDSKTGKFDEHKVLLSFPDKDSAVANYKRAFSDGKGQERIGHVAEMPIERFKDWLHNGNTKAPIAKGYASGGAVYGGDSNMAGPDTSRKVMQAISLALETARKGSDRQGKAEGGAAGVKGRDGTQGGYAPRQAFAEPYEPTWRDRVALALRRAMGNSERPMSSRETRVVGGLTGATGAGDYGPSVLDLTPAVGLATLGADAAEQVNRGNHGMAVLDASLMALPYGVGKAASRFFRHADLGAMYPGAMSELKSEARFGQVPSLAQELKDPDFLRALPGMEARINKTMTGPLGNTIFGEGWSPAAISARSREMLNPSSTAASLAQSREIMEGLPRTLHSAANPAMLDNIGDVGRYARDPNYARAVDDFRYMDTPPRDAMHADGGRVGRSEGGLTRDLVRSRLAQTKSFRDMLEDDPRGRFAYDPGSIRRYDEPSLGEKALAAAEWPARTYAGQFDRATDAVAEALGDPTLANVTNAGVQTGLTAGSPLLTGASGALGFGIAGAQDLIPPFASDAVAKEKRRPDMKPAIFEPAAAPAVDPIAEKYKDDPTLSLLHSQIEAARADSVRDYPGRNGDASRAQAAERLMGLQTKMAEELAKRDESKRLLEKGNYDRQVEDAIFARDKARSRDKRFSDTEVGKVYDKLGGYAPVVAGMVPGAAFALAKGPAKTWSDALLRAGTGAGFGVGAINVPIGYDMAYSPVVNPEKEAMRAYSYNLPDGHPDKAKSEKMAAELPEENPVHAAAKDEFSDLGNMAKRSVWGAIEGAGGQELGGLAPRAIGGLFKPSSYGLRSPVELAREKIAASKAAGLDRQADLASVANREAASKLADSNRLALPPSSGPVGPASIPGSASIASEASPAVSSSGSPVVSRALDVAKGRAALPSPATSAALTSDKASDIIKHFKKENVIVRKEGDREVARFGPGRPEGGQWTSHPKRGRSKASKDNTSTPLTKGEDVPVDKNGIPIKPPKEIDPNGPGNFRAGGIAKRAINLARKYAAGGVVVGPVTGHTGGREDALPVDVPAGSFVIPADIVSALGTGNTLSGNKVLDQMFGPQTTRAAGGAVPIKISDGEHVIAPETVARIGNGNMEAGHRALEKFVLDTRRKHIDTLKSLPGPSR